MTHSRSPPRMARNLRVACALRLLVRTRPREWAQKRAWTPRGAGAETHLCYHQPRQSDLMSHRPQVCAQRFVYRSASSWVTERIPARCTTTSLCAASGGSAELRFERRIARSSSAKRVIAVNSRSRVARARAVARGCYVDCARLYLVLHPGTGTPLGPDGPEFLVLFEYYITTTTAVLYYSNRITVSQTPW